MALPIIVLILVWVIPIIIAVVVINLLLKSKVGRIILLAIVVAITIAVLSIRREIMKNFNFETYSSPTINQGRPSYIPTDTVTTEELFFEADSVVVR